MGGNSISPEGIIIAAEKSLYHEDVVFPFSKSKYSIPVRTDYRHREGVYLAIDAIQNRGAYAGNQERDDILPSEIELSSSREGKVTKRNGKAWISSPSFTNELPD